MKTSRSVSRSLSPVLSLALLLTGLVLPSQAQDRVIIVNADQPNVWTLEQAHYLLAQMHRRNLDLRAKSLEELDPNEINGLRFDVLRQLMEFGATFSQADRFTNQMLARNKTADSARRSSLISERDKLRDESLDLTRQISDLQTQKVRATTQEEKDRLDGEIAAKTALRDKVDKEIQLDNDELKTLGDASGEFKETTGSATFDPNKLPKSVFDKPFEEAVTAQIKKFNEGPELNATLRLDNFLQMQYEIIAKQLTLLRDEVGPGERLLFLELPQTVNVSHHEADKKWAQSWWRIDGYVRNSVEYEKTLPESLQIRAARARAMRAVQRSTAQTQTAQTQIAQPEVTPQPQTSMESRVNRRTPPEPIVRRTERIIEGLGAVADTRYNNLSADEEYVNLQADRPAVRTGEETTAPLNDRTVRTIELIPRQSSLNVNDMKLRIHAGAFNFVLKTLFGFGSQLNVQRQREQFSQFVQQELYSAAFGKGSREFGWTFTPMPGTDRLMSGVRTTYAVVIVPAEATDLIVESNGCYFPRSAYQPNNFDDTQDKDKWNNSSRTSRSCGTSKAFLVPIPVGSAGENNFVAQGVTFQPVGVGERVVVSVYGYNFSSQMGVLINGSPLTPAIGLAQPLLRDDSKTGGAAALDLQNEKVHGRIERVDSEQMVFSFEMPEDFSGTPTITLVSPGKAINLNQLTDLYINGKDPAALAEPFNVCPDNAPRCVAVCAVAAAPGCVTVIGDMFVKPDPKVRIDALEVFRSADGRILTVLATGKGFINTQNAFVNGVRVGTADFVSSNLIRSQIPTPPDENIQLVLSTPNRSLQSRPIPNPAFIKITNVTVISDKPASGTTPAVLVVKLEGVGFSSWLRPSIGTFTSLSSTEALLRIDSPALVTPIVLRDRQTGLEASTVITRKVK